MPAPKDPVKYQEWKNNISRGRMGKARGDKNPSKRIDIRKKISKANKGKHTSPQTEFKKGHPFLRGGEKGWFKKGQCSREKSHFWKGGKMKNYPELIRLRKSGEYRLWRKAVFERDNFTCQKCGQKGGKLIAHHINNFADFPELRFNIDNGITFCKKCHKEFHKKYGKNNNTLGQLQEFFGSKK